MKYGSVFMLCAMIAILMLCLTGPAQAAKDDSISADQDLDPLRIPELRNSWGKDGDFPLGAG